MREKIIINDNPARQEKNNKIKEISFVNSKGAYFGLLMSLRFFDDKPAINLYRIDKGIKINCSKVRE